MRPSFAVIGSRMTNQFLSLWPAGPKPPACSGCPHANKRGAFVPGYGKISGRLILIGERPGSCEDGTCRCSPKAHERLKPFVGKSGKKIDVGLGGHRGDCFVTNVRKCNAIDADKEERAASIAHCVRAYLQPEMDAIDKAQKEAGIETAGLSPIGADATGVMFGRKNMQKFHGTVWTRSERDEMASVAEALIEGEDEPYE